MNSSTNPYHTVLHALKLKTADELQDVIASLILSEGVYKAVDVNESAAIAAIASLQSLFPPTIAEIRSVQFCRRRVAHRYLLATGGGALYAAFMGTKELRDVAADMSVGLKSFWQADGTKVHGGFLSRASGIPIETLLLHALQQGKRLVLCGHSLGGAVAQLITLRLLDGLRQIGLMHREEKSNNEEYRTVSMHAEDKNRGRKPLPFIKCISFGTPALGNAALSAYVRSHGWETYFLSYALPEDPVPRIHLQGGYNASEQNKNTFRKNANGFKDLASLPDERNLEDTLYQEETENIEQVKRSGDTPIPMDDGIRHTINTVQQKETLSNLFQFRPKIALFPTYSNFGRILYLTPSGVSLTKSSGNSTQFPSIKRTGLILSMHRMPAYRARLLDNIVRYSHDYSHHSKNNHENVNISSRFVEHSANLAPQFRGTTARTTGENKKNKTDVVAIHASAAYPILWTPTAGKQSSNSFPTLSTLVVTVRGTALALDTCTAACIEFLTRPSEGQQEGTNSISARRKSNKIFGKITSTASSPSKNFFPSGSDASRSSHSHSHSRAQNSDNKSKILGSIRHEISNFQNRESSSSSSTSKSHRGFIDALLRYRPRLFRSRGDTVEKRQNAPDTYTEVLELTIEFSVPSAELVLLAENGGEDSDGSSNATALQMYITLFSDFDRHTMPVRCSSRVSAWIMCIGENEQEKESLQRVIMTELQHVADADCAKSWALLFQTKRFIDNEGVVSGKGTRVVGPGSSTANTSVVPFFRGMAIQSSSSGLPLTSNDDHGLFHARKEGEIRLQQSHLKRVTELFSHAPNRMKNSTLAASSIHTWKDTQQRNNGNNNKNNNNNNNNDGNNNNNQSLWEDVEIGDEFEYGTALEKDMSLGTRLRRKLQQALQFSSSSKRVFRENPNNRVTMTSLPDILVIVASQASILTPTQSRHDNNYNNDLSTDENAFVMNYDLNIPVIDDVHALVNAATRARVVSLLALDAPEAVQSASFRRRLMFITGLHGRPGAVVPLKDTSNGSHKTELLQIALLAYAHALSGGHGGNSPDYFQKDKTLRDSIFRARL